MASELFGSFDVGSTVSSGLGALYLIIIIVILPLFIGGIIWLFYFMLQFKHTMLLELVTGGKNVMKTTRFREKKTKEGTRWQLFGTWEYLPTAPARVIKTTTNGSMFVELAYSNEGNYQWKNKKISPEVMKYVENDSDQMVIRPEESFTTIDKRWYVSELKEAEQRRKQESWLARHGASLAMGFILLIALGIIVFGAEEIYSPIIQSQGMYLSSQTQNEERNAQTMIKLAEIEKGVQEIKEAQAIG